MFVIKPINYVKDGMEIWYYNNDLNSHNKWAPQMPDAFFSGAVGQKWRPL